MLKTHGLSKQFDGVKAVDRLSVEFAAGKITGVIGPNGSGKSTLINTLTGMFPFEAGAIVISGVELSRLRAYESAEYGVTRTFQDVRLFEQMPVLDNILVVLTERNTFASLFEKHKDFHVAQAEAALKKVGLWEKRGELAANLSYGQRKLLEIARVLAMVSASDNAASIIFLDEPFAGLFPEMIKTVVSVIKELRAAGKTIILVEHNMDLIRELCDHLIVMDAGQLLAQGLPEEVLKKPEVIEAYLGE